MSKSDQLEAGHRCCLTLVVFDARMDRDIRSASRLRRSAGLLPAGPSERPSRMTLSQWVIGLATAVLLVGALAVRSHLALGFVTVAAVMIPLERAFALHPQRILRRRWTSDVVHFCFNNILTLVGLLVLLVPLMVLLRAATPAALGYTVRSAPAPLQFLGALLVADLCGYWSHRASHRVPRLWRFHAVHHSIEEMDWLAAARLHPVDQAFRQACIFVPLYLLGFSKVSFGGVLVFLTFQALFIHANVRFTLGPLRWGIATPTFHHWHHASAPEAYNTNFAGELPVLDAIFGTLHVPKGRGPKVTGPAPTFPRATFPKATFASWPHRCGPRRTDGQAAPLAFGS
jgi:sterol desaturase/sphingolipid hydroxylase (fatty acid hydroxylase superfamily)